MFIVSYVLLDETKKEKKRRSYSTTDQPPERPLSRGGTMREQDNVSLLSIYTIFDIYIHVLYTQRKIFKKAKEVLSFCIF